MTTGEHYFFTSEQEQNQMFHICSCLLDISMTICRQCFNAAQLTAPERGWRPQHWAVLPMPDVPACCRNNTRRSPAFNKSHPMPFLCLPDRGEMLNPPLKPTAMTPNIPSHGSNDFTLLPIIDKILLNMFITNLMLKLFRIYFCIYTRELPKPLVWKEVTR